MTRTDGRTPDALRPMRFTRNFLNSSAGAVLVEAGETRVLCTVSIIPGVPNWMRGKKEGWLTAEYAMLPGSVEGRKRREFPQKDGRSVEIQRLIGRTLRAALDFRSFPDITLAVDCDVLQADGGTRCASITGAMVALEDALKKLDSENQLVSWPLKDRVAAVSVGLVHDEELLDLDYSEDFAADVDMNVIGTASGKIIEVQGTAEGEPFARGSFNRLLDLGMKGVAELTQMQEEIRKETVQA